MRGINHFVPHAFSAKAFPDPDCPPHFYAHGNNPQYRHFGKLMAYANRVCELISDGKHIAPVGILYQAESDWTGKCVMMQEAAMQLADRQIDYDFIPSDVFEQREDFYTRIGKTLKINHQEYQILLVPEYEYITKAAAAGIREFLQKGGTVIFNGQTPKIIGKDIEMAETGRNAKENKDWALGSLHISLAETGEKTAQLLEKKNTWDVQIVPAARRIRYLHYQNENGTHLYMISNEGNESYKGIIRINHSGSCYGYNAWENILEKLPIQKTEEGTLLQAEIEPLKPLIVIFDNEEGEIQSPLRFGEEKRPFTAGWKRSICRSIDYPAFKEKKAVKIPDDLAEEWPDFSGFVRYENQIVWEKGTRFLLEIQNASEGVEVFVNNVSAGIQVAPPFRYDLTDFMKEGENEIAIEAATTLEREMYARTRKGQEPTCGSGITGLILTETIKEK